jgi:hypothetical protein
MVCNAAYLGGLHYRTKRRNSITATELVYFSVK